MKKSFYVIIFGTIFIIGILGCSKSDTKSGVQKENQSVESENSIKDNTVDKESAIPVRTGIIEEEKISETLELQGNISAKDYAVVPARLDGIVEKLYANEGSKVIKGKTKLFMIDSENLENNLNIQKHGLGVAESSLEESKANLERVKADNYKTVIDYERSKRLLEKNVITRDLFEQQESRYKQSNAGLKHAEAVVKLAEESVKQATAAFAVAQRKLADAVIFAPVSGYISKRYLEEGEMAKFGAPVFRIDNTDLLELSAFLPSEYYSKIQTNKTRLDISVNGIKLNKQIISYRSPTLDENFRTFEIKSIIKNSDNLISSGSMANIKVYVTEEKNALTIPKSAIITKDNKSFVFTVKENRAVLIEIISVAESDGKIAVSGKDIQKGVKIILEGQSLVKDGGIVNEL